MTEENRRAAVEAEWKRSDEALDEAEILLGAHKPTGAVSRGYYAAFHAARALLFSLGLQPRSHQGVRSMINLHLVQGGRLEPRLAQLLSQAARSREDADYDAAAIFSSEDAQDWIDKAREFRKAARALLAQGGWLRPG